MFHWTIHLKGHDNDSQAAVVVGHKVYSFEGNYNKISVQIEVHIFNTVSLRWRKLSPWTNGRGEGPPDVPSRRWGHTAVLIADCVYIWGGYPYCNLLYGFDVDSHRWFKPDISGTVPEVRYYHTACVLEKVMYIHGGSVNQTGYTNDMYKLDTTTMVWALINTRGTSPPVSVCHSATIIGTKFVFGGCGDEGVIYNIRVFDTETNNWLNTPHAQPLPERLWGHAAFAYNGELYIYGGYTRIDVWKFNPVTFTWNKVELKGNGPSQMYYGACCMVGDRIILSDGLYILDLSPTLKTLCKLVVIQYGVEQSELPHNIRWELAAMTKNH